ncbi:MAG: class I SAM-dependent methyltransferase [Anaerolineales bacterium]|nr:class I SAM-dependent methyltransferase [Anaerolineales bacterium]
MNIKAMIDHDNLEEFNDPANYDLEEAERSADRIQFYTDLAHKTGGPVLEIACGTGLVALPIAARGLPVTGVDLARPMLAYARVKAQQQGLSIDLIKGDARQLHLNKQFAFIYLTGNAFQAFLQRTDQERLLASVKRHLAPHGIFAFETRNPSGHDLSDQLEEELWFTYRNVQGQSVNVSGTQRYDPLTQTMHWTTYRRWNASGENRSTTTRIACRFTYPRELETLLHYNGFQTVDQYGDWDKSGLAAKSEEIISICRHRKI